MYAFAQRDDCHVFDEPLYAAYLAQTGHDRPYKDLVMESQSSDPKEVMAQLSAPCGKPYVFAKHIAKFKVCVDHSIFKTGKHLLLIREPYNVLQSWTKVLRPTQQELAYTALLEVASELRSQGSDVHLVLSDQLVATPEGMLRSVCSALDIPWQPAMLSWPAGPKPYDGVWAPWWYASTYSATGFGSAPESSVQAGSAPKPLPDALKPLLGECQAVLRLLRRHALSPSPVPAAAAAGNDSTAGDISRGGGGGGTGTGCGSGSDTGAGAGSGTSGNDTSGGAKPPGGPGSSGSGGDASGASRLQSGGGGKHGTHSYAPDPRNADVLVLVRDGAEDTTQLVWRPEARVSVLDSGFMLGDGVWEGIRLHKGVLLFIEEHLSRLYEGATALDMALDVNPQQMQRMMYDAVDANGMGGASDVHIRLMVSRGLKPTPYQSPYTTIGNPTIVVVPEWKQASAAQQGISLFTVHVRRGAPDVQDPMWNSHSKLNCIAACIQAKQAGADEALMLDPHGFVATCNSVNFFVVRRGEVWAPTGKYQLHGITRANVLTLCRKHGIPCREADFSLTQVYSADEAFVTGTFAGLIPVRCVDGRMIGGGGGGDGTGALGPVTSRLSALYGQMKEEYVAGGRRDLGGRSPRQLLLLQS
ncbi:hypothetical protein FOA52_007687 [Chlamydomonas sp. UWO 241]|nr:hypothetical protein FOA52_007687 [Chlamydomonas sp. UWO 241]